MTCRLPHLLAVVALLSACSSRAPAQVTPPPPTSPDSAEGGALPPAGFGTLNQDQITLRLRSGTLEIRFLPLDQRVLRLLAPDAYTAYESMLVTARAGIDSVSQRRGVRQPGIALVSFHALAPNTRFDPQVLIIEHRNRQIRPIGVLPMSPTFSAQQLGVREQASGIFLFDDLLPVTEPFSLTYLETTSSEWERRLPRLDAERTRVLSRAGVTTPAGGP